MTTVPMDTMRKAVCHGPRSGQHAGTSIHVGAMQRRGELTQDLLGDEQSGAVVPGALDDPQQIGHDTDVDENERSGQCRGARQTADQTENG